jgi:hypothetical protein
MNEADSDYRSVYTGSTVLAFWRIEGCKNGGYKEKTQITEKAGIN